MINPHSKRIARLIQRYLIHQKTRPPSLTLLEETIEVAFYASMKSDEARHVICTLTFVDSSNPPGEDPPLIRPQRRSYVPFEEPIAFNVRNLVKLAQASPPWASCIAIGGSKGQIRIYGVFDQEIHYRNAINQEDGDRFDRPGIFQIEITGIGALAVLDDSNLIATLNQNTLVHNFHDVLRVGPIAKLLGVYASKHLVQTVALLKEAGIPATDDLEIEVRDLLTRTLARILLSVKRAGHGGAVLLIPRYSKKSLRIKHLVHYDKLDRILPTHVAGASREFLCSSLIEQKYLDAMRADFPDWTETGFYPLVDPGVADSFLRAIYADGPTYLELHQAMASRDKEDAVKGELGGIAFVSALSRVDGLVLLSEGLTVRGFGVEITCREEPQSVYLAGDETASTGKLRPLDYSHYGTRHRSMMRYCHAHEGAVGFVISQDGDVRAMTRVAAKLIVWENIKLQEVEVVKTTKKRHDE